MELRQYQKDVLNKIVYSAKSGHKRILLQAATGSGKTVMSSALIKHYISKDKRIIFLAHRRELITQASKTLDNLGVDHGVIMAGMPSSDHIRVQLASIDTLRARVIERKVMELPSADLIVIDEAHRSASPTYLKLLELYEKLGTPLVVGLTATPIRSDGTGLGNIYTDMVQAPSIKELTENKSLVTANYYAPSLPDLRKVGTIGNDYNQKDLNDVMDKPKLVGNIVETWKHIANDTSTIVFASSVKHSMNIANQFQQAGVIAAHIDGTTDNEERLKVLTAFNRGDIRVICNCMVLTEGFDAPIAQTCVLARPTKSLGLYIQMVGRVLRPYPGKANAIVIDHSGAVHTCGFATDDHEWVLTNGRSSENERKDSKDREEAQVVCDGCFHVFSGSNICPNCGHIAKPKSEHVAYVDGLLGLVDKKTKKVEKSERYGDGFKKNFFEELMGYAIVKGYNPSWCVHSYRVRFKTDPDFRDANAKPPSKDTKSYITYLNIRRSKRRK